jgi:hypothetical protein
MPPVGFEPTIAAGERPYTYVLDRAATGTGKSCNDAWMYLLMGVYADEFRSENDLAVRFHRTFYQ